MAGYRTRYRPHSLPVGAYGRTAVAENLVASQNKIVEKWDCVEHTTHQWQFQRQPQRQHGRNVQNAQHMQNA